MAFFCGPCSSTICICITFSHPFCIPLNPLPSLLSPKAFLNQPLPSHPFSPTQHLPTHPQYLTANYLEGSIHCNFSSRANVAYSD